MKKILTDQLIKDIQNVGASNFQMWLEENEIKYSQGKNFYKSIENALVAEIMKLDDIHRGLAELEENSDKKIHLYQAKGFESLAKDKTGTLRHLHRKHNYKPSTDYAKRVTPRETPTFNYMFWDEDVIKIKFSEKHYKVEADYETHEWKEKDVSVYIVILIDTTDGFVQIRYDNPGNRHRHKNDRKKSTDAEYEKYYKSILENLFEEVEYTDLNLNHIAKTIIKKREIPFLIHKDVHSLSGGGKLIHSLKFMEDVRDRPEYQGALASEGGADWITEDLSGFWLKNKSDDQLKRDLFMRISRKVSEIRVQRGCLEKELNYGITKIREIQKAV